MENVLLVAYLLIVLALIAVILIQRSEGGGLGMGSANSNGLISVRGQANLLTRTTAVLAALFFVTAIGLTILAEMNRNTSDILDSAASGNGTQPATVLDALSQMGGGAETLPLPSNAATSTPATSAPATDAASPAGADPVSTETDPGLALPITPPATSAPAQESAATSSAPAQ
jgi:preprotein translocase subunit SecG